MCCAPFAADSEALVVGSHLGDTTLKSSHSKDPHARATAPTFPAFFVPTRTTVTSSSTAGGFWSLPRCDLKSLFDTRPPLWVSLKVSVNASRRALSPRRLCFGLSSSSFVGFGFCGVRKEMEPSVPSTLAFPLASACVERAFRPTRCHAWWRVCRGPKRGAASTHDAPALEGHHARIELCRRGWRRTVMRKSASTDFGFDSPYRRFFVTRTK
jgi:hypothetical protein